VAQVSKDPVRTFEDALGDHLFELWTPGKRIRGVYLGMVRVSFVEAWSLEALPRRSVDNVGAIISSEGTIPTFPWNAGHRDFLRQLKPLPVGTLVSIECETLTSLIR
jgi:hypothetical protein